MTRHQAHRPDPRCPWAARRVRDWLLTGSDPSPAEVLVYVPLALLAVLMGGAVVALVWVVAG